MGPIPSAQDAFPTPVTSVQSLLKCHLLRETFSIFALFKFTTLTYHYFKLYLFLLTDYLPPEYKHVKAANDCVLSLLYPHGLEPR